MLLQWSSWYVDTVWANRYRAPLGAQLWAILRNLHHSQATPVGYAFATAGVRPVKTS